jgi:hypothetical protein
MQLKDVFQRVHPDSANLLHGRPLLYEINNDLILAQSGPSAPAAEDGNVVHRHAATNRCAPAASQPPDKDPAQSRTARRLPQLA